MVAGVAYSSFAFKPLWHPPLVGNASFAIQNTIPMESMKTLKFVFSCSQGKNNGKHIAARRAKHMRGAYDWAHTSERAERHPLNNSRTWDWG